MKPAFISSVDNLIEQSEGGNARGPMSPVDFARETMKQLARPWNGLARIAFNDAEINQCYEEPGKRGLTGHDHLLIAAKYRNDTALYLFVDIGTGGIPVATMYKSDTEAMVTTVYTNYTFEKHLTKEQIAEIFKYCFENFESCFKIVH